MTEEPSTVDGQNGPDFHGFIRTAGHAAVDYQFRFIAVYQFRSHKRGIDFTYAAFGQQYVMTFYFAATHGDALAILRSCSTDGALLFH